jgi:hypothetical protein
MRKILVLAFILFSAFFVFGLTSCSKKEAADTPYDRVQGKWKKVKYANDDNNNGTIEFFEIHPVEGNTNNELLFNKDYTGMETNPGSPDLRFTWKIVGKDSVALAYTAHFNVTYYLREVSSVDLTLMTNTTLGIAWYYYVRP